MSHRDLVVVVADAFRLRAIRLSGQLPGRVLYFSDSNLASALETIRAHEPGVVALEARFTHMPEGRAFTERLQRLGLPGMEIHLINFSNDAWSTGILSAAPAAPPAPIAINTRRVPRFSLVNPLAMQIDGQSTPLVDISIMGAQVLSTPPLRPNQRLKVMLPDEGESPLAISVFVAWSAFELPSNASRPLYRAGMEFTDAAAQAIEQLCRRHCSGQPLPERFRPDSGA